MIRALGELFSGFRSGALVRDTRGSYTNIGYIIQVGITTIVILGIISGMATVVDTQQEKAVNHQATVIGEQVAASVMAADRAGGVGAGTDITLNRGLPGEVVGTPYTVRLVDDPAGAYVLVEIIGQNIEVKTPVNVEGDIVESSVSGGSEMQIVVEGSPDSGDTEIHIQKQPAGGLS